MTNPFEDESGVFHVLVNEEGQHSLWPSFREIPAGWTIVHKSASRAACLEFIEQNWTDMLQPAGSDQPAVAAYLLEDAPVPSPTWTLHGELGRGTVLKRLWAG